MANRWFEKYHWGLCVLSGLLLVVSFAPFSCATASWIALVPAWWLLTRSEQVRRQPVRHGYLIGIIYFGGVFWWISNVTGIGTLFLVLYLALYPALWFLFVARLLLRSAGATSAHVVFKAPAAAALWVTLEWWRSWFLTGFNWNELGDAQAPSIVFRQLAAFGGIHLISFVLVTVNILWADGILGMVETFREKKVVRPSLPFAVALLIVALCFALGWHHLLRHRGETLSPSLTFACIQPNIPQIPYDPKNPATFELTESNALKSMVKLSKETLSAKPDLLIWPEAIIDEGVFEDVPMNEAVHDICVSMEGSFLLGSQDFDRQQHKLYNSAYLFDPGWYPPQEYRKTRLVILGEFLPFGDTFPWLRHDLGIGMDFTPGPGPAKFVMDRPGVSFAPLICFEDTLPEVADKAVRLHPDFFVTITNDGWYWGWTAAWGIRQHLQHSVFRCVEHDRSMIRCASTGISCEIDQDGTVTDRFRDDSGATLDVGGIFSRKLEFYPAHETLYEDWGDWIVLISSLVTGILGVRFFFSPLVRTRER